MRVKESCLGSFTVCRRPGRHSCSAPGRLGLVPLQPIGAIETPSREGPAGKIASLHARSAPGAQICSKEQFRRGKSPNPGRLQHPNCEVQTLPGSER